MKIIMISTAILSILSPLVLADADDMMGFGMMNGGMYRTGVLGILYFLIASFIFSLIFWRVYTLIVKKKGN